MNSGKHILLSKFNINSIGSDLGQKEVLQGKVDMAMISSEIPKGIDTLLQIVPVARLGVVPIISSKNPYLKEILHKGMTRDELVSLFTNENPKTWGDLYGKPQKDPVKIYIRADSSGATKVLVKYLWVEVNEIKGTGIEGEIKLVEAIKTDPLALGYCNFIYALDPVTKQFSKDIQILPIDFNQNGMIDGKRRSLIMLLNFNVPCGLGNSLALLSATYTWLQKANLIHGKLLSFCIG